MEGRVDRPGVPAALHSGRVIDRVRQHLSGWLVRDLLVPFAATRIMLECVGWLALNLVHPPYPFDLAIYLDPPFSRSWLNIWSRWDSDWYLGIAQRGYIHPPAYQPGQQSSLAFSPLYPLAMRVVGVLLGRTDRDGLLLAGFLIANVALLVALGYLIALVRRDFDEATAGRTALYLLIFPTSLFLSAVYPESLFLALVLASFSCARRRQWWVVGALGGLATLARPHGVLVALPLAFEYLAQRKFDLRALRLDLLALGLIPAAYATWMAYVYALSGDPWMFLTVQSGWYRQFSPPWEAILNTFSTVPLNIHAPLDSLVNLAFTILFLILVAASWWLVRPGFALFASVLLVPMVSTGHLGSLMRFGLALFPAFIVLALAGRHPWFDRGYVILATGLCSLFMAMFALRYWVA
ncbi:MAG: hypothetical protein HY690_10595 [Chloroflexi bacterium]|nr:hypothetical protein [Chloroflexota bacterium]